MKNKQIFISWSRENSKMFANKLKTILEQDIYKDSGLSCFVSDVDIASGEEWWAKIKKELKRSSLGIVCITKENINAPWIYYEAGAMIARGYKVIPLIIGCNPDLLKDTPLSGNQRRDFYDEKQFTKMIFDINQELKLIVSNDSPVDEIRLKPIIKAGYEKLKELASEELERLKNMRVFNEKYIYPKNVSTVNKDTLYISAPMSTISSQEEYDSLHKFLIQLNDTLINADAGNAPHFLNVFAPAMEKETKDDFDGASTAIRQNFIKLKQVDCMLVIYPENLPSSLLVEVGYGIALGKRIVIFYKKELPYILKDAGNEINHVKVKHFNEYEDILLEIKSSGRDLFNMDED